MTVVCLTADSHVCAITGSNCLSRTIKKGNNGTYSCVLLANVWLLLVKSVFQLLLDRFPDLQVDVESEIKRYKVNHYTFTHNVLLFIGTLWRCHHR